MRQRNNKVKIMKVNVYMAIMSHLSDAQYFIDVSTKSGNMARQLINLANKALKMLNMGKCIVGLKNYH